MQSIPDPLYHAKVFILDWVFFARFILFVTEFVFTDHCLLASDSPLVGYPCWATGVAGIIKGRA
jgi:hypothetical protein